MKKLVFILTVVLSSISLANESDNAENYCADLVENHPEKACAVNVCR